MFIYIFPYIFLLFVGIITFFKNINLKVSRFFFFIALLPVFFLVIFRGEIGTDTSTYEKLIEFSADGNCKIEPLFCLFSNMIFGMVEESDVTLRVITAIFCLLFFIAFSKTKTEIVIACFFIFPVFFYDMSTNGIRYGIAFILFKLLYDGFTMKSIFKTPIYLGIQTSSFILIILSLANKIDLKKIVLILFIFCILFILVGQSYFAVKLVSYLEYSAPNFYSGILNFLLGFLIISTFRYFRKISLKEFLIYGLFLLSFQILTQFTYAGLRVVQLMLFYFAIRSLLFIKIDNSKSNIVICFIMFLTGLIYFLNLLRIMFQSGYYLPYEFIF